MKNGVIMKCVLLALFVFFLIAALIIFKNRKVKFTFDITVDGKKAEIVEVTYSVQNSETQTEYKEAKYKIKDGMLTICNKEKIKGGAAFATYNYHIVFSADGQLFESDFAFVRTNGQKVRTWKCDVTVRLYPENGKWNADIACDDCESVKLISVKDLAVNPLQIQIIERFGSIK